MAYGLFRLSAGLCRTFTISGTDGAPLDQLVFMLGGFTRSLEMQTSTATGVMTSTASLPVFGAATRKYSLVRRPKPLLLLLLLPLLLISVVAAARCGFPSTIYFTTLGRSRYTFDIYTLPILPTINGQDELQLTDGQSVNYNGHFPSPSQSSSLLSLISNHTIPYPSSSSSSPHVLIYVTERHGTSNIYLDVYTPNTLITPHKNPSRRSALEMTNRLQFPLLHPSKGSTFTAMKDRPSILGDSLIYVSTHEDPGRPRRSWAAVYSTRIQSGETRRLTPPGQADFSPAVSPSGEWIAVASEGERGWGGEVEDLNTDIIVFRSSDPEKRFRAVTHGGWPTWVDDSTFYFHRRSADDGWMSVYRAVLPRRREIRERLVKVERLTPPAFHAFTPAASPANKSFIALATRRPGSDFRHVELFDVDRRRFVEVTRIVSPNAHHYNPFIFPDGSRVGYHKCRGRGDGENGSPLFLESLQSPTPSVNLFRIDGSFPSFSPDGERIAYVGLPGLYVANRDGSGNREVFPGLAFATGWDWKRKGVLYTSIGPVFATEHSGVDVVSINVDEPGAPIKKLTTGEGPWTDTMCNWSPDGEWIAFASDRDKPGDKPASGSFAIYLIHPNGTGLKRVVYSGEGGKANHPWFSPDSRSITFTTDYAAVSAEPIANPHHYQPYGDIFIANIDGSGITRLTHNSYEDGTPTWGPKYMKPADVVEQLNEKETCEFEDCHWLSEASKQVNQVLDKRVCA
ncbi:hypothetical protein Sjap_021624 [Stephania japonica]|uniref:Uncharacterized protein n=1 Tax=Stephania japonica TaxID=461633 RepID=A0AAP0EQG7_9MAGN